MTGLKFHQAESVFCPEKKCGGGYPAISNEIMPNSSEQTTQETSGAAPQETILEIDVDSISPNPFQIRKNFSEESLQALADCIVTKGLLQPILVREFQDSKYQLIVGERRWRAHKKAGLKTIKAIVRKASDEEMPVLTLVENIHRDDLSVIEEAEFIKALVEKLKTPEAAAKMAHMTERAVRYYQQIAEMPVEFKNLVSDINNFRALQKLASLIAKISRLEPQKRSPLLSEVFKALYDEMSALYPESVVTPSTGTDQPHPPKEADKLSMLKSFIDKIDDFLKTKIEIPIPFSSMPRAESQLPETVQVTHEQQHAGTQHMPKVLGNTGVFKSGETFILHLEAGKQERSKEDYIQEAEQHFHFFIEEYNKAKTSKIHHSGQI